MRLSELTLERYGRFEGCNLTFRSGTPDLHVIYGANEAGKSTTMAAVSDLLFGFPVRSPQNYRFDYPLLRVGAVLEEGGARFSCRRRKANAQSLVDADDRPIDEAPLLAMLRGQDRERFWRGFSLDQTRLREGGQAMVGAKDDLGQALFAAGSGLTGVAEALAALEREADDIWGKRAAARRLYTIAERRHEEAQRALRELQLRPKAWTDAQTTWTQKAAELAALETTRADLAGERRRLERLRRISPDVRRRADLLAEAAYAPRILPTPHAISAAETALDELAVAERARLASNTLLEELDQEIAALALDNTALGAADAVEALLERRGAEQKASLDLTRLQIELRAARSREDRLRSELGGAPAGASRLAVARLRELAARHVQLEATLAELRGSATDAERRAQPLRAALTDAPLLDSLPDLAAAVDAARTLGGDLDARCADRVQEVLRLEAELQAALARLTPWAGPADALSRLPDVGSQEIDAALSVANDARKRMEEERAAAQRAADLIARLDLERRGLAESGGAVTPSEMVEARGVRDGRWARLRGHLVGNAPLSHPAAEAAGFDVVLARADDVADRRFALAEASGQVAALEVRRAETELEQAQAQTRELAAETTLREEVTRWAARLSAAGLPELEPTRLRAWREARDGALATDAALKKARDASASVRGRRRDARARLVALLPTEEAPAGDDLAPVLELAARRRAGAEDVVGRFRDDKTALRGLEDQISDVARRAAAIETQAAQVLVEWAREREIAGLDLQIAGATARLALLDELRTVTEGADVLATRVAGIGRDADLFSADVAALAAAVGQPLQADVNATLDALRARATAARSAADGRLRLQTSRRARTDEIRSAEAAAGAARTALAQVMQELGVTGVAELPAGLDEAKREQERRDELLIVERRIKQAGDGLPLDDLAAACKGFDAETAAAQVERLDQDLAAVDGRITEAADATGVARRTFEALETGPGASKAAADVALARAEMDTLAETYLLKRSQAVVLRWAQERYRERNQNPLLLRASALFSTLTLGRYRELRTDPDAPMRLLGVFADGARVVGVEDMSEGATDQLFLALRLAAVEQAITAGARLPFLADDLFVNFDDERACAGLQVLADLARSTQVLVFTHHPHLLALARSTVGADAISECPLPA